MAKLSPQTLSAVFDLQQRLVELIDVAKAAELNLFEHFGETEATLPELDQLQHGTERLRNSYDRLHTLALGIAEIQSTAPTAMLNLLVETVEKSNAPAAAVETSIAETQRNWNLP